MTDQQLLEFNPSDVFTPDSISKRMSSYLLGDGTLLEPAVGKGHLLKFINIDFLPTWLIVFLGGMNINLISQRCNPIFNLTDIS